MRKIFWIHLLVLMFVVNGIKCAFAIDGYEELAYIQATGGQIINTGIYANDNTAVEAAFINDASDSSTKIIIADAWSSPTYMLSIVASTRAFEYIGTLSITRTDYWQKDTYYTVYMDKSTGQTVNGVTTAWGGSANTFTSTKQLTMFGVTDDSNRYAYAKLFYLKIWQSGTLVRDFVPVRRISDSVIGMYDNVSNSFFTNAGSGSFTAGYTVAYSCGSGSGTAPTDSNSPYLSGTTVTTLSNTCTAPSGQVFHKWSCGGTSVNAGAKFTISGNTTCTAQYKVPGAIGLTWYDGGTTINGPSSCTVGGTFLPPTPAARTGFVFNGWKVIRKCGIDGLSTSIGGRGTSYFGYTRLDGTAGSKESNYGLTRGSGQWAVEFSYGTVWGIVSCNNTPGTARTIGTPDTSVSGQHCWCQVNGFTASGNSYTSGPQCTTSAGSSWMNYLDYSLSNGVCEDNCAYSCAWYVRGDTSFRAAIFGVVGQ